MQHIMVLAAITVLTGLTVCSPNVDVSASRSMMQDVPEAAGDSFENSQEHLAASNAVAGFVKRTLPN